MKKTKNEQVSGRRRFLKQVAAAGLGGLVVDMSAVESAVAQQPSTAAALPATARIRRPSDAVRAEVGKRQPATTMRDPRNVFSGLIVDPTRNEVIMAEENNFSLMVYDRETNTPPRAALSEPKRMIGGENTNLEYVCGVYVDPASGDIYAINNDTLNWMTVFDRNAKGNVAPNRRLATPHTTFGIVADEEAQELLMTIQDDHAVTTFKKTAKDQEAPLRTLQGPKTMMADPHGIALDAKSGLIYVTNWGTTQDRRYDAPPNTSGRGAGKPNWPVSRNQNIPGSGKTLPPSITVYRKDAQGDVAPIRVIQGPKTLLNWPTSIAVHPERGEIFVANDPSDTVTVYRTDANGDVAPIRVIKGPRSLVKNPVGVALDLTTDELWVANFGSHSATVFPVTASGDAVPKRVIRSAPADAPSPMLSNPHTMSFDSKRGEMLVSNCVGHPQIAAFARTANGAAVPTRAIYGQKTTFTRTIHDMAYDAVKDEILVMGFYNFAILTFRGDANGDVAPVRTIMGPKTQIVNPQAVAIDAVHGEIFIPQPGRVLVFQREAVGDVAPIRILEGVNPTRVTIDPLHDFLMVSSSRGIQIFDRKASGNAQPLRIITGPGASDVSQMTTYPPSGMIFGVVRPDGADDISGRFSLDDFIGVWSVFDDGPVPARLTIGGPDFLLRDARGIAVDPKSQDVMCSDKTLNAILRFHVPEAFVTT